MLPESSYIALLPTFLTPVLIAGVRQLVPKIPGWLLPILAPLLGAGLDILNYYATGNHVGLVAGAVLGSAGVGLREAVDQAKKRLKEPTQ